MSVVLPGEAKAIQGVDNANFGGSDTEIWCLLWNVFNLRIIATALFNYCGCPIDFKYHPYTIMSRATEIQIMRLVGAKNSYIRRPYLMEGAGLEHLC